MFAPTPEGEILTDAPIDHLQHQATHDADPLVRATANSIPQIYDDLTFRELTWALTREAALGPGRSKRLPPISQRDFRKHVIKVE